MFGGNYASYKEIGVDLVCMRFPIYLIVLLAAFAIPIATSAQVPSPRIGITVTPSIVKLDLAQSPPVFSLVYKNTTSSAIELTPRAEDFTALEEGWNVKFLDERSSASHRYTLSSWIKFETSTLLLNPGEARQVKVFIDAQRLSPGGHYASILAEIKQDREAGQIGLRGILSSLLFVRTATGQERVEGAIQSFAGQQRYFSFPTMYALRFQNTGNVELVPYGLLEIKNYWGKVVAKGIVNEASLITLPESIRRYEISVKPLSSLVWPGIYKAQLILHIGSTETNIASSQMFISIGTPNASLFLMSGLITIVVAFFLSRKGFYHRIR